MNLGNRKGISEELEGLENPVVLALIDPVQYHEAVIELLSYFTKSNRYGIYVSLNKPYSNLLKSFDKAGIPTHSIFFVDGITNVPSIEETDSHTCLGSGVDLSNLCIAISKAVGRSADDRFLFLDSLTTLLIYNEPRAVAKFAHLLTEKMRRWNSAGSLLAIDTNSEREVVSQLAPFCDKVVKL